MKDISELILSVYKFQVVKTCNFYHLLILLVIYHYNELLRTKYILFLRYKSKWHTYVKAEKSGKLADERYTLPCQLATG